MPDEIEKIKEMSEEALDEELEHLHNELEEVKRELDLYEEDYMEDLEIQKSSLETKIRQVKKTLRKLRENQDEEE